MTDETRRHERLARWFEEASALQGAALDAFLDTRRAEDASLHAELCELLDHDTRGSDALDAGLDEGLAAEAAAALASSAAGGAGAPGPGDTIGPYAIERPLGEGGFALVYEARQREPVTRDVALKILRPGMDSASVLGRFAAELQAQARMDHEHVARVFDAGTTAEGRPYLAMELVDGLPITRWCKTRALGLRARLELFVQACEAVQHAHQKGVIHRDIKPSNVLVAEGGAHGRVKIIDFGIAKAIEGSLTEDSLRTLEGQLVGTPEYMSPEQAGREGEDLDTRTDVYSLGVLLYELVSGSRPFDFSGATLLEIQRAIHGDEPPRPSQRIARDRLGGAVDGAWERGLRADLDWVALRALEKDPARRYDAVAGLAADVQRFLDDEPVEASPPSRAYRAAKFVRRNRTAVVAAALVFASLAGGLAWSLVERGRAVDARADAQARAEEFERVSRFQQQQLAGHDAEAIGARIRSLVRDEAAEAFARRLGVEADDPAVEAELAALDEALRGANFTNVAMSTVDGTFLSALIEGIDGQFRDEPRIRARLLQGIALAQDDLGLASAAVATGEQAVEAAALAFGPGHADTLRARIHLADARHHAGDFEGANADFGALLTGLDRGVAPRDPDEAARMRVAALRGRAQAARLMDDRDRARRLSREAYEIALEHFGPDEELTILAKADTARTTEDPARKEALLVEVVDRMSRLHGEDAPHTLRAEENLAHFLADIGRTREARAIRARTLPAMREALGDRHRSTLRSIESLGLMKHFANDDAGAEVLIREAWEGRVAAYGPDAIDTVGTAGNLAMVLGHLGRDAEAVELYEAVLPAQRAAMGREHQDVLGTMTNLGISLLRLERYDEAAEILGESLGIKRRVLGVEHPFTRVAMEYLAAAYRGVGRGRDAHALEAELLGVLAELAQRPEATAREVGSAAERILSTGYADLRDVPLGLKLAERAVALEEEFGGAMLHVQHSRVGLAHWYRGDMEAAIAAQRRAIETAPERDRERMEILMKDYEDRRAAEGGAQ